MVTKRDQDMGTEHMHGLPAQSSVVPGNSEGGVSSQCVHHVWVCCMCLCGAQVSLKNIFERGQAYVALSRARSLEGLQILDYKIDCVKTDPEVARFYRVRADSCAQTQQLPPCSHTYVHLHADRM